MSCKLPPKGWYCTREAGHEGPCAALPESRLSRWAAAMGVLAAIGLLLATCDAKAAVFAVATNQTAILELHDTAEICVGEAKWAEFKDISRLESYGGCWTESETHVFLVFLDGGAVALPKSRFSKPKST